MRLFRGPQRIGDAIRDFTDRGLNWVVARQVCGKPYDCPTDECHGCYGLVIIGHLENQIGEQGIAFMKQLAEDWPND